MKRLELVEAAEQLLRRAGFHVSSSSLITGVSFDIIARRDNTLLTIKVLANVDSLDKQIAHELKLLASLLDASPLVVGFRSTAGALEQGVMYKRYDIPIVSLNTLCDFFLENVPPMVEAGKGGYYVTLDGRHLEKVRLEKRISLSILANSTGVSKRTIQQYEKGMRTTIEIALKLEEITGEELIQEQDLLNQRYETAADLGAGPISTEGLSSLEREIIDVLLEIGCKVVPLHHCQMNALTKEKKNLIITGVDEGPAHLKERAKAFASLARITEHPSVFFLERDIRKKSLEGIPIIHKRELKRIGGSEEIIEIIIERSK